MSWRAYKSSRDPRWKDKTGVAIAKRGHGPTTVVVIALRRDVLEVMGIEPGSARVEIEVGRLADAELLRLRPSSMGAKVMRKGGLRGHGEVAVSSAGITRAVGVSHKLERLVPGVGWRWGEDGWLYLRRPAWLPPLECDAGKGE